MRAFLSLIHFYFFILLRVDLVELLDLVLRNVDGLLVRLGTYLRCWLRRLPVKALLTDPEPGPQLLRHDWLPLHRSVRERFNICLVDDN